MRRPQALEAKRFEDGWVQVTTWKNTKSAKHQPFQKLMAQLSSGLQLLEVQQSRPIGEVVKILQHHVNDVDCFLERTNINFTGAAHDVEVRIRYLQLSMACSEKFDALLDDKKYRMELLTGNEKIDQVVDRTTIAVKRVIADIDSGIRMMGGLRLYLDRIRGRTSIGNRKVGEILSSMYRNEHGWTTALKDLQMQGERLGDRLLVLGSITSEMARRAGVASRRNMPQSTAVSPMRKAVPPPIRSKFAKEPVIHIKAGAWVNKPLPQEPRLGAVSPDILSSRSTSPDVVQIQLEQAITQVLLPPFQGGTAKHTPEAKPSLMQCGPAACAKPPTKLDDTTAQAENNPLLERLRSNVSEQAKAELPSGETFVIAAIAQGQHGGQKMVSYTKAGTHAQCRRSIDRPIAVTTARSTPKTIDRRPVAPPKDQKHQTKQMDTTFVHVEERASPVIGTGFSPRRTNHIPEPIQTPVELDASPSPIDSARLMSPHYPTAKNLHKADSVKCETPSTPISAPPSKDHSRSGSRLGLFPKSEYPPSRPRAATQGTPKEGVNPMYSFTPPPDYGKRSNAHQGAPRAMALTNFFHKKGWSTSRANVAY